MVCSRLIIAKSTSGFPVIGIDAIFSWPFFIMTFMSICPTTFCARDRREDDGAGERRCSDAFQ